MERAELLAAFTEEPGRLTRRFGTQALAEAGAAVSDWMRAAGMAVRRDAVGNVHRALRRRRAAALRAAARLAPRHGAATPGATTARSACSRAIAAVERLATAGARLPFALEVVAFADEEGARFGTAFLGSSRAGGQLRPRRARAADADGVSLEEAIRGFGGDPGRARRRAREPPGSLVGYAEVHIEQGPVLEERGLPLGVVSGIAGQTRAALRFEGAARATPARCRWSCAATRCARRRELVVEVEAVARGTPGLVATVGRVAAEPGAANVIPGRARLSPRRAPRRRRGPAPARPHGCASAPARSRARGAGCGLGGSAARRRTPSRCDPGLTGRAWSRRSQDAGVAVVAPAERRRARRRAMARRSRPWRCCSCAARAGSATTPPSRSPRPTWRSAVDALGRFVECMASRYSGRMRRRSMTSLRITAGPHEFTRADGGGEGARDLRRLLTPAPVREQADPRPLERRVVLDPDGRLRDQPAASRTTRATPRPARSSGTRAATARPRSCSRTAAATSRRSSASSPATTS